MLVEVVLEFLPYFQHFVTNLGEIRYFSSPHNEGHCGSHSRILLVTFKLTIESQIYAVLTYKLQTATFELSSVKELSCHLLNEAPVFVFM